jgi:BCD family chlorophyll transporter-like MFS transporter
MRAAPPEQTGLALGVWGAVTATSAGVAIALGGVLRDVISAMAQAGLLGEGLAQAATGYVSIYLIEIVLLFITLAVVGPLVRSRGASQARPAAGLAGAAQI